jgi:hypothetical protein
MRSSLAGLGFVGFATVSLLHFVSVYRIAAFYDPALTLIAAVGASLLWLALLALVARGMYHNRLALPMAVVFGYGMLVALAGMGVLDGVPSAVGEGKWRDPDKVLTPKAEFLLHNHGVVKRVLSRQEYDLYSAYGLAFFSGIGMVFCAAASLGPLDRDGQLFRQRRPAVWALLNQPQLAPWALTAFRCPTCRGAIGVADGDKPPPWCPRCGADLGR